MGGALSLRSTLSRELDSELGLCSLRLGVDRQQKRERRKGQGRKRRQGGRALGAALGHTQGQVDSPGYSSHQGLKLRCSPDLPEPRWGTGKPTQASFHWHGDRVACPQTLHKGHLECSEVSQWLLFFAPSPHP